LRWEQTIFVQERLFLSTCCESLSIFG
jgi:hypothetical protein